MTESLKIPKQAEGVYDGSCRCWCHGITSLERRHKHCSYSGDEIGKTCCGIRTRRSETYGGSHSNSSTPSRFCDSEHQEGRLLAEAQEAAATLDLDDDAEHEEGGLVKEAAEAAAATAKEKPKRRDAMSKSQENKNGKICENNDEIRSLVDERRNIAKGEKHKLRELNKRIKKMHQRKEKSET